MATVSNCTQDICRQTIAILNVVSCHACTFECVEWPGLLFTLSAVTLSRYRCLMRPNTCLQHLKIGSAAPPFCTSCYTLIHVTRGHGNYSRTILYVAQMNQSLYEPVITCIAANRRRGKDNFFCLSVISNLLFTVYNFIWKFLYNCE